MLCLSPRLSVLRRKSDSLMHMSRARTPSTVARAAMELRLLNRKCGLICAFSALISASRASVRASCSRDSDSLEDSSDSST